MKERMKVILEFLIKTKLEMPKKRKIFDQNKCGEETSCSKSTILKIGIISDTHGKSPDHTVLSQLFRDVQEIWHAGDIAGKDGSFESASAVISNLCRIAPVKHIVRGNVDTFCGGLVGFRGFNQSRAAEALQGQYPEVEWHIENVRGCISLTDNIAVHCS
jgi:hypothetical protein